MAMPILMRIVFAILLPVLAIAPASAAPEPKAKNIIICIADGSGFNSYAAASYYEFGRLGCQVYDRPEWVKYASRTVSRNQLGRSTSNSRLDGSLLVADAGVDPASVWDARVDAGYTMAIAAGIPFKGYTLLKKDPTDSAAAATAMASGQKTYNGRINYAEDYGNTESPLKGSTIAELAKAMGKSCGVVTTVQWNDATPAGFGGAHNPSRTGRKDIANEMLTAGTLDVIMGAGHPQYDNNGAPRATRDSDYDIMGGVITWELLKTGRHSRGWKMVQTKAEFEALANGPTPARVLGLPQVTSATQHERQTRDWNRDGKVDAADIRVAPPFKDPFNPTIPSLMTMSRGALNVLNQNRQGFFLLIEGGAVDHAGHLNQPGRLIEEQIEFNHTIRAVVDWVNANSNWEETLVIISADHETGLLWGSNSDMIAFDRMLNRGARRTPAMWFNSGSHSNSLVPLRARGAGASLFAKRVIGADPVLGEYVENTSIFEVMKAAIGAKSPDDFARDPMDRDDYDMNGSGGNGRRAAGTDGDSLWKPGTTEDD